MQLTNSKKRKIKSEAKDQWHIWFAWYPVKLRRGWVWLEFVLRKRIIGGCMDDRHYYWIYDE